MQHDTGDLRELLTAAEMAATLYISRYYICIPVSSRATRWRWRKFLAFSITKQNMFFKRLHVSFLFFSLCFAFSIRHRSYSFAPYGDIRLSTQQSLPFLSWFDPCFCCLGYGLTTLSLLHSPRSSAGPREWGNRSTSLAGDRTMRS